MGELVDRGKFLVGEFDADENFHQYMEGNLDSVGDRFMALGFIQWFGEKTGQVLGLFLHRDETHMYDDLGEVGQEEDY